MGSQNSKQEEEAKNKWLVDCARVANMTVSTVGSPSENGYVNIRIIPREYQNVVSDYYRKIEKVQSTYNVRVGRKTRRASKALKSSDKMTARFECVARASNTFNVEAYDNDLKRAYSTTIGRLPVEDQEVIKGFLDENSSSLMM